MKKEIMEADGIHKMIPEEQMAPGARKLRDTYSLKPDAPLFQREFGFYSLEKWKKEGMPDNVSHDELFRFDPKGQHCLQELGWCEAPFVPSFEEKIIEDRGPHEVVQDPAGRHVLYFKGRRQGFMPEYLDHPVKDLKTWEEKCKWRLDPETKERYPDFKKRMEEAKEMAGRGMIITQKLIGGYMYLRSLIGPEELLYKLYDDRELIHHCMQTWLELADAVIAGHQRHVTLDELFIAEDICYNHGPLISPGMIENLLFPYYKKLLERIKTRQIDKKRPLHLHVDTDGYAIPIIPLYQEAGMDVMSPFEVASGCDVVKTGTEYPGLIIIGGIDKRVLARTKEDIDRHLDSILPAMKARGGYIPTCDHGVPEEVPYENYLHYRKRCLEFA